VHTSWAKLVSLLCLAVQVMLGGGVLAAPPVLPGEDHDCPPCCDHCDQTQKEDRCCQSQEPAAPIRPCCCSHAAPRTPAAPAERTTRITQATPHTPAPISTPAFSTPPAVMRPGVAPLAPGSLHAACGILTTRLRI